MHILIAALHKPAKPTGVCRHATNLARCLAEMNEVTQVTLVTGAWQKHYFETSFSLTSEKINLIGVDIRNNSLTRNFWFLLGLPKLASELRPDIVHLSFPLPFLRSQFSCPVVATIHDLYPYECPENFGRFQSIFNRLFLSQCLKESDGLSCVSQVTLAKLNFFFTGISSKKETTVIYNYVNFSNTGIIPAQLAPSFSGPFLLSVAQHRKNKNLDLLINAYSLLLTNTRLQAATQLIIVGSSGPETENLETQIRSLNLQQRVHLLSLIDDDELCWLYQNCELFVIPSAVEGFGLPLVEALSQSCQAVCSDIPIFREVASSNCTFFSLQGNAIESLTHAILKTLVNPLDNTTTCDTRFTKYAIASQYLKFYIKLVERL